MSDEELRALERQYQTTPDEETGTRLFNARRRAGFEVDTIFALRNSKNGRYFQSWFPYGARQPSEVANIKELTPQYGLFKNREDLFKEVKRLQRGKVNISNYQIVEVQTMRLETAGPSVSDMTDQIELELLQAKKESQLKKLKKLEVEEQALLEIKKKQEKEKLAKLQKEEEKLQKKLSKTQKKEAVDD